MQSAMGKEDKGIGIGGKGALDKINTEGTGRSRRRRFYVKDGTDSSEDNGRSQGMEGIETKGDGRLHCNLLNVFLTSVTCTTICRSIATCPYHIKFHCNLH